VWMYLNGKKKMGYTPLYSEVCLLIQQEEDVELAVKILKGRMTIWEVAETKGQDLCTVDGDGDVLILTYLREHSRANALVAERIIGTTGDRALVDRILPALQSTKVPLEVIVKYCNLSVDTVFKVADAISENKHLVGFSVIGNPGNDKVTEVALKNACIETLAPLKWFQGETLPESILEARQVLKLKRVQMQRTESDCSIKTEPFGNPLSVCDERELEDAFVERKATKKPKVKRVTWNERETWMNEVKSRLRRRAHTEEELDSIVASLELYQLQQKIECILSSSSLVMDPKRRAISKPHMV